MTILVSDLSQHINRNLVKIIGSIIGIGKINDYYLECIFDPFLIIFDSEVLFAIAR